MKYGVHAGLWMARWTDDIDPILRTVADLGFDRALLHKSGDGRSFPIAGQTYPATSVIGVPRAV